MRSIDFLELRALRMSLFFAGGHTEKEKKHPSVTELLTT